MLCSVCTFGLSTIGQEVDLESDEYKVMRSGVAPEVLHVDIFILESAPSAICSIRKHASSKYQLCLHVKSDLRMIGKQQSIC